MVLDSQRPRMTQEGRDLGDEYLFYDRAADKIHLLNESAREILLLCDGTRDVRALIGELIRIYGIDRAQAESDFRELMLVLSDLGLVTFGEDRAEES